MDLRERNTQRARIICMFGEQEMNVYWNHAEERYDPELVERWNMGRDNGHFIEPLYQASNDNELPENYWEKKVKLDHFQPSILGAKRYFLEEQGLLLVTVRKNGNNSTYYYLSNNAEDVIVWGIEKTARVNSALQDARQAKQILLPMKPRTKRIKAKKEQFLKTKLPRSIKII